MKEAAWNAAENAGKARGAGQRGIHCPLHFAMRGPSWEEPEGFGWMAAVEARLQAAEIFLQRCAGASLYWLTKANSPIFRNFGASC